MKQIRQLLITVSFLCFSALAIAASHEQTFVEGKDYKVIAAASTESVPGKVTVMEFFSYGCPGCYLFEPIINEWVAKKPKFVNFEKVPVVFHQGWDVYAKAFYVAKSLNVLNKISQPLFDAIHKQNLLLTDEQSMADFFAKHGISRQDFISQYEFMPMISAEMAKSDRLMRAYGVYEIPAIVIDGKYRTSISMVNGDVKKFFALLNYLADKARKSS